MAVVATLSKGYDLDYIWTQVNRDPARFEQRYGRAVPARARAYGAITIFRRGSRRQAA